MMAKAHSCPETALRDVLSSHPLLRSQQLHDDAMHSVTVLASSAD